MRIFAAVILLMGLTGPALAQDGRIEVTGVGRIDAVPDMAVVSLGAAAEAENARDAMAEVSAVTGAIIARLEAEGIASRDMQTSGLSLNPVWKHYRDDNPPQITGFAANNRLTVRVRDLDQLGSLLDKVLQDGANKFNGLSFALQDPEPAMNAARRAAVADARAKAELYASAAGVTLGKVILISEAGRSGPEPMMMERAMMSDSAVVPIAAGEVTTEARITILFEIAE